MSDQAEPRRSSRRILLISPLAPYPANYGGAQRTAHLLRALARHGEVGLYLLEPPPVHDRAVLARDHHLVGWFEGPGALSTRICRRAASAVSVPVAGTIADAQKVAAVAQTAIRGGYDTVVLRYSATACQLHRLGDALPGTVIIVDTDDLLTDLLKTPRGATGSLSRARPSILRRLATYVLTRQALRRERSALQNVDGLWYTADPPAGAIAGVVPCVDLPNIPWAWPQDEDQDAQEPVLPVDFIGVAQFRYGPNLEGFDWFLSGVWPAIRLQHPAASLRLIGLPPLEPHASRWRQVPGVEVVGTVGCVRAHYDAAKIAVAPILSGGGTKIKVLEAMALGLPCVATVHAAHGLSLLPVDVAHDAAAFADLCLKLLHSKPLREQSSAAGIAAIAQHHSFETFSARVGQLLSIPNL